jgi:hypothetical protein
LATPQKDDKMAPKKMKKMSPKRRKNGGKLIRSAEQHFQLGSNQKFLRDLGDQIGRIFTYWVVIDFWQFFRIYTSSQKSCVTFP